MESTSHEDVPVSGQNLLRKCCVVCEEVCVVLHVDGSSIARLGTIVFVLEWEGRRVWLVPA